MRVIWMDTGKHHGTRMKNTGKGRCACSYRNIWSLWIKRFMGGKRYLAVAEKPSLCKAANDCCRNHRAEVEAAVGSIDFIALAGHVCTWMEPNDYKGWDGKCLFSLVPQAPCSRHPANIGIGGVCDGEPDQA